MARKSLRRSMDQAGFEALGVLIAVVTLAAIGFVGYKVVTLQKPAEKQAAVASEQPTVKEPEQIKTRADLTATGKALDRSLSELDSSLDDSTLDADINALL